MNSLRINLFTCGDSQDVNTYSNVPYYFRRALLDHGCEVNPIDLTPSESNCYRCFCNAVTFKDRIASVLLSSDFSTEVFRTKTNNLLTDRKLRKSALHYSHADLNVFMTFTFSSRRYVDIPVIHYADRTYEHHLLEKGCIPSRRDHVFIQRDRENVDSADLVLTMNQACCDFIRNRYKPRRLLCLQGGINTDVRQVDVDGLIAQKESNKDVLFIGRGAYSRGVDILIEAFRVFNEQQNDEFTLHIVGVTPEELPKSCEWSSAKIRFYGYLDRNVTAQKNLYDQLMRSARLFVFPMRPGPVAGVIREAQLNCTPVVISNVPNAFERVTDDYNGVLVERLDPKEFARHMNNLILDVVRWRRLARAAHDGIKHSTWSKTVENFLQIVTETGLVGHPRACHY